MKTTTKSTTQTKMYIFLKFRNYQTNDQQPIAVIQKNSLKILHEQTSQQITRYLTQNKITTFAIKNQKCSTILNLTLQIFKNMMIDNQNSDEFLNRIINFYLKKGNKVYDFLRCLKYFAQKNYQFQYIQSVAKGQNIENIAFYMKCRSEIIDSFLNKSKRQLLISVIGDQEQWYKIVKKFFKNVSEEQFIQLFTDTIKHHYLNIKKYKNQLLNGSQILRICQIMNRNLKDSSNKLYQFDQKDQIKMNTLKNNNNNSEYNYQDQDMGRQKQKQVKKLLNKNIIDGLEAQDRELIRILSYKDNNIARLLQKKHEKMIEIITEDVQKMRTSIEQQKNKYLQLWQQKQQIVKAINHLNYLALTYMFNNTFQNQQKLLKAVQSFNIKFKRNTEALGMIKKLRQSKKNKRLIQLIQRQERQKC